MWCDKRHRYLGVVLWFLLRPFLAELQAEMRITLRPEAKTSGRQILLGEIADISSDAGQSQVLSSLALGYAPAPEIDRILTRADVFRILQKKADSSGGRIIVDGAESVRIRAIMVALDPAWVGESIRLELSKMFPEDRLRLHRLRVKVPGRVLVSPNGTALQPDFRHRPGKPDGMMTIRLFQNGKKYRSVLVQVEMSWEGQIPTAVRNLSMGERLGDQDVQWTRQVHQGFPFDLPLDPPSVIGMRVRLPVKAGEPIRESILLPEKMIEKGDLVQVIVLGKGFSVQTTAMAEQAGVQGQKIRLIQPASKRTMIGRVTGRQKAEILL